MDQRTRKLMTMHKVLHPRDDVDRLYVSRKEGGRGLARIEDTVDASIQWLEDFIEKHERGLKKSCCPHQQRCGQHDKRKRDNI